MDPIAQWLAGIFGALAGEVVRAAAKDGKEAFAKWLKGARGEEVEALQTALALALKDFRYEPQGERFVAFLEQKQNENDTAFGDALLRALLVEPQGFLSLTPALQTQITLDLQPLALKFMSLFHTKLWSQSPFDKLLAAKAAQDELRLALETLQVLQRIEKEIGQTHGGVNLKDNAHLKVDGDFIVHDQIIQGHKINVAPGGHLTIAAGSSPIKPEELAAAKRAYLEFVVGANNDVKPPSVIDAQNRVTLQLDEIYIPVTITFKEIRAETDKKDKRDKSQEEPPKRIELAQIVRDSPRAVLLGEPGAGKTTILRYLALHFAKTLREHPDDSVNVRDRDADFGAARLPLFIRLATFASAKRTLREYILDEFGDVEHKEAVKQVLADALSQGKALILLDGLDEVLDNRADVIEQIESFDAGLEGRNRVIVTSRRSSYERALGGAFKAFDLNELEQEQIAKFLMYWNLAIEKKRIQENGETFQTEQEYEQAVKERAQEQFTKIAEKLDTNLGAQNLAKNPLTLRMLAEAYRWSGDLPNRRVDLYNLIVKQSLEFWETQVAHIPKGRNVSRREAVTRLAPLAYWMHSENESPSEDQITERLGEILASKLNLEPTHPDVENAVEDFWTRVKERTGLFVQDTPNHYRFVHATFREYFAGLYLVQDRAQAAQRIYAHRYQPRWEEPILLGIAHTSTDDPKFASELIRTAILAEGKEATRLGFEASRYEDVLHRDLLFATKCVRDCISLDESLLGQLFGKLAAIYGDAQESGKFPIREPIDAVLRSLRGSEASRVAARFSLNTEIDDEFIFHEALSGGFWSLREWGIGENTIKMILLRALKHQDPEIRRRAVSSLGHFPNLTPDDIVTLAETLRGENNDLRVSAVVTLLNIGKVPPIVAVDLTNIALEWSGEASYEAGDRLKDLKGERPEVIAVLIPALESSDPDLQRRAIRVSGQFGRAAPNLVATLLRILQDKDEWLETQIIRWVQSLDHLDSEIKAGVQCDFLIALAMLDKEHRTEEEVINWLCELGNRRYKRTDAEYFMQMLKGWRKTHIDLRIDVATALERLACDTQAVVTALIEELRDQEQRDYGRLRIAESLVVLGSSDSELVTCLIEMFENTPPQPWSWEREHAIELLGQLKSDNLIAKATLIAALKDEEADIRVDAARGLGNLHQAYPDAISALVELSRDDDQRIVYAVEISLGRLASKNPQVLIELTESGAINENYLDTVWSWFVRERTPLVDSVLLGWLNDPNLKIATRCLAASNLKHANLITPEIVRSLALALRDDNAELRQSAADSLEFLSHGDSDGTVTIPVTTPLLKPLEFATPEVVESILNARNDEDPTVRNNMIYLLGGMENEIPNVIPMLLKAFDDPSPEVREKVASVLSQLRQVTPRILAALFAALQDQETDVKQSAWEGLSHCAWEGREWTGFDTPEGIQMADALYVMLQALSNVNEEGKVEVYGEIWTMLWRIALGLNQPQLSQIDPSPIIS